MRGPRRGPPRRRLCALAGAALLWCGAAQCPYSALVPPQGGGAAAAPAAGGSGGASCAAGLAVADADTCKFQLAGYTCTYAVCHATVWTPSVCAAERCERGFAPPAGAQLLAAAAPVSTGDRVTHLMGPAAGFSACSGEATALCPAAGNYTASAAGNYTCTPAVCSGIAAPANAVAAPLPGGVPTGADLGPHLTPAPGYTCSGTATAQCTVASGSAAVDGTFACSALTCSGVIPPGGAQLTSAPGALSTGANLSAVLAPLPGYSCTGTGLAVCPAGGGSAAVAGYFCTGLACSGGIQAPPYAVLLSDRAAVTTGTDVTSNLAPVPGYACSGRATAQCAAAGSVKATVLGYVCSPAAGSALTGVLCSGPFFCPAGYSACRGCAACAACGAGASGDCCAAAGAIAPGPFGVAVPWSTLAPTVAAEGPLRIERVAVAAAPPACVTALFRVWDASGRAVRGLSAHNVFMAEGGAAVAPAESQLLLSDADTTGFATLLLLDTSGSLSAEQLPAVRQAVSDFITSLFSSGRRHEVAVAAFDGRVGLQYVSQWSSDRAALLHAVQGLQCDGVRFCADPSTDLNGALIEGSQVLGTRRSQSASGTRSFLVVFSDGSDQAKRFTDAAAVEAVRSAAHRGVYAIAFGAAADQTHLRNIASDGALRQAGGVAELGAAFAAVAGAMAHDAETLYRVDYCSPARDGAAAQVLTLSVAGPTAAGAFTALFTPTGFTTGCSAASCASRSVHNGTAPTLLGLASTAPSASPIGQRLVLAGSAPPVPSAAGCPAAAAATALSLAAAALLDAAG
eukprot:TRINITY_DN26369_c2_g1_i1.p1 TRINITY_DN26369_c2_g1~~TRINITY_DN26369_c2_g1_i1.p1  ORF type:complete len:832 (+),score=210.71 TRINITY_DN26369_c2_g1_i1:109-2496(+)